MDYSTGENLGNKVKTPVAFCCDSKAVIHIDYNLVFYERIKNIGRDYHCVRNAVKAGLIEIICVNINDQIVDILTKALGCSQFKAL